MDSTTDQNDQDTYPNAGRDSGYVDEQGRSVDESLVNKLTILVSGIETKLLLQGQQTRADIAAVAKAQTHSDRARLLRNTEFQQHIDRRFDAFGGELTTVAGLVREVQSSQAIFQAAVDERLLTVEQRVGASEEGLSALRTRLLQVEDVNRRLDELAAFRDEFRAYAAANKRVVVDELKAQMSELLKERAAYTPQERARLASILIRMIAEWEAAHPEVGDDG